VGRRYGDFSKLYKRLRTELPGKVLPPLPKKNKSNSTTTGLLGSITGGNDSEASSISSVSTQLTGATGLSGISTGVPNGPGHQSEAVNRMLSVRGKLVL
jgi:hypothetical protein